MVLFVDVLLCWCIIFSTNLYARCLLFRHGDCFVCLIDDTLLCLITLGSFLVFGHFNIGLMVIFCCGLYGKQMISISKHNKTCLCSLKLFNYVCCHCEFKYSVFLNINVPITYFNFSEEKGEYQFDLKIVFSFLKKRK